MPGKLQTQNKGNKTVDAPVTRSSAAKAKLSATVRLDKAVMKKKKKAITTNKVPEISPIQVLETGRRKCDIIRCISPLTITNIENDSKPAGKRRGRPPKKESKSSKTSKSSSSKSYSSDSFESLHDNKKSKKKNLANKTRLNDQALTEQQTFQEFMHINMQNPELSNKSNPNSDEKENIDDCSQTRKRRSYRRRKSNKPFLNTKNKILANLLVSKLIEKTSIALGTKIDVRNRIMDIEMLKCTQPENAFITLLTESPCQSRYNFSEFEFSASSQQSCKNEAKLTEWDYFMMRRPIDWISKVNLRNIMPSLPTFDFSGGNLLMRRNCQNTTDDSTMKLISKLSESTSVNENSITDLSVSYRPAVSSNFHSAAASTPNRADNLPGISTVADDSFSGTQSAQQCEESTRKPSANGQNAQASEKNPNQMLIGRVCSPPRNKSESRQAFAPDLRALAEMLNRQKADGICGGGLSSPQIDQNQSNELNVDTANASRPPFSMATLVYMAVLKAGGGTKGAEISDICTWICNHFPYYRHCEELQGGDRTFKDSENKNGKATPLRRKYRHGTGGDKANQNFSDHLYAMVRHTLSSNKCFQRMSRLKHRSGKGSFWRLDPTYSTISIYKQFYDAEQEQFQNDFYSLYCDPQTRAKQQNQDNCISQFDGGTALESCSEYLGENYVMAAQYTHPSAPDSPPPASTNVSASGDVMIQHDFFHYDSPYHHQNHHHHAVINNPYCLMSSYGATNDDYAASVTSSGAYGHFLQGATGVVAQPSSSAAAVFALQSEFASPGNHHDNCYETLVMDDCGAMFDDDPAPTVADLAYSGADAGASSAAAANPMLMSQFYESLHSHLML